MERSRSPFAPPEIEVPQSFLAALRHQTPVHEVVRRIFIELGQRPAIVGQNLVPEIETEHTRDRRLVPFVHRTAGVCFGNSLRNSEQLSREDRRPQAVDALRIDVVELLVSSGLRSTPDPPSTTSAPRTGYRAASP